MNHLDLNNELTYLFCLKVWSTDCCQAAGFILCVCVKVLDTEKQLIQQFLG